MKSTPWTVIVLLLHALPGVQAGFSVDVGVARVAVTDRFSPDACTTPSPEGICLAGYTPGEQGSIGDSTLDVYQSYRAVEVDVRPTVLPVVGPGIAPLLPDDVVAVRTEDLSVRHSVFILLMSVVGEIDRLPTGSPVHASASESGLRVQGLGAIDEDSAWGNGAIIDYEHVRAPPILLAMSVEKGVIGVADALCDSSRPELATAGDACRATAFNDTVRATTRLTPDLRTGFAVQETRVNPNADPASLPATQAAAPREDPVTARFGEHEGAPALAREIPESPLALAYGPASAPREPEPARDHPLSETRTARRGGAEPERPASGANVAAIVLASAAVGLAIAAPAIALYRRLTRTGLLTQSTRREILRLVDEAPGISVGEIASRLGVRRYTVDYHVHLLEKDRLVVSERQLRRVRLYPPGAPRVRGPLSAVEEAACHPLRRTVLAHLLQRGHASVNDLVALTASPDSTVRFHVARLVRDGLVARAAPGPARGALEIPSRVRQGLLDALSRVPEDPTADGRAPANLPSGAVG